MPLHGEIFLRSDYRVGYSFEPKGLSINFAKICYSSLISINTPSYLFRKLVKYYMILFGEDLSVYLFNSPFMLQKKLKLIK